MKQLSSLKHQIFGHINNQEVSLFTLRNENGMEVKIMNYGAIITSIKIPSKVGVVEGVLGFDTLEEYLAQEYRGRDSYPYFGAVIGRNAGRVRNATFMLDGKKIELSQNIPPNQLHGGKVGFDSKVWEVQNVSKSDRSLTLRYLSKDGEEGYPGNLTATVTYTLTDDNEINIEYQAVTDADTVVNLTQHTYFNFNKDSEKITNHNIQINASKCLPLNADLTPLGITKDVTSCDLDFRLPSKVPTDIDNSFIRDISEDEVIGKVECEETGIQMEVKTNYPILHIYSAYYTPELTPKNGRKKTGKNAGVCFEAQKYPDALNHPLFPTNKLTPDETYKYHTSFKFYF